jgi:A/G-specific adenine glycosylase
VADPGVAAALLAWRRRHGRRGLPWQGSRDPYRVWLSEIMLQQTRVATVPGYYARFLDRYPDVAALAGAPLREVLRLWAGLGYYARARNLHRCAIEVVEHHGGVFPRTCAALAALPGIGRSTAAAIAAFCHGERAAILDANARRVVARLFAVEGDVRSPAVERLLWQHAQSLLPARRDMPSYTQAIMDLGAGPCAARDPACGDCPVRAHCAAFAAGRVGHIPARRAARARELRRAHVLVVLHRGRVLLEERPAHGVWGGLLAPPLFPGPAALRRAAAAFGPDAPVKLPARRHGFTHFTLEFTSHLARAKASRPVPPGTRWVSLAGVEGEALPAPIRRLLTDIRQR